MLTKAELSYISSLRGETLRSLVFVQKLVDEGRFAAVIDALEAVRETSALPEATAYLRSLLPALVSQHLCRRHGAAWADAFAVWAYRHPGWGDPLSSAPTGTHLVRAVANVEAGVDWSPRVAS